MTGKPDSGKVRMVPWLGVGLANGIVAFQTALLFIAIVGGLMLSGPAVVIEGGSMEPTIDRGDVVLNVETDATQVVAGTIVVFSSEDRLVTHRVVDSVDGKLQTRGDANRRNDSSLLSDEDLRGQARLVVPFVGLPKLWWNESNWLPLAIWIAVAGSAFAISWIAPDEDDSTGTSPAEPIPLAP